MVVQINADMWDMKKIVFMLKKFNWKLFASYSISFGLAMSFSNGNFNLTQGLISGLLFGFFMTLLIPGPKDSNFEAKINTSTEKFLFFDFPLSYIYLMISGFFMFDSSMYLSQFIFEVDKGRLGFTLAFGAFAALQLWGLVMQPSQMVIGQRLIVFRRRIGSLNFDKIYDMSSFDMAEIGLLSNFKFKFKNKTAFSIWQQQQALFADLPEYTGEVKNKNFVHLYKLKQLVEERSKEANSVDLLTEKYTLTRMKTQSPSALGLTLSALAGLSFVFGLMFFASVSAIKMIENTKDTQAIKYNDVKNAFAIFGWNAKKEKAEIWQKLCDEKQDHNCRLSSYLYLLEGDEGKALQLVKQSCGPKDPFSCYNVLLSDEANKNEKDHASSFLTDFCDKNSDNNQVCCDCYKKLDYSRSPASKMPQLR